MTFILGILKIIILLGTLVTIHELGHFLVAKACNVKVHKFAIGFGPKIISKVKGETEYAIRAIPFGGFVQMEGEDSHSEDDRAFNKKPVWQRMLIVVAGATVNIIFALLLYYGVSASINMYASSIIDDIVVNSEAYNGGLRSGDKIVAVNGKKTTFASQVSSIINELNGENVVFTIQRDKSIKEVLLNIPEKEIGVIGAAFSNNGEVAYLLDNSVAKSSGISEGDKIIAVNGIRGLSISEYIDYIKNSPDKELEIIVDRNGEEKSINLIPEVKKVKVFDVSFKTLSNLNFIENSYYAIKETSYYFTETIKAFLTLITGKVENASVMGPVGIAGEITKTQGFSDFFYLMSAISLSLGIFNLLPVPGLDGGKFLFLIIELIRKRPMDEKTEIAWQLAGFALIITIAIIVTAKDVVNLF